MNAPLMPELYISVVDAQQLMVVAADIDTCAQLLGTRLRSFDARRSGTEEQRPAADAARLLVAGKTEGVQWRYLLDGTVWLDTVMATPAGYRLVRMAQPPLPPAPAASPTKGP